MQMLDLPRPIFMSHGDDKFGTWRAGGEYQGDCAVEGCCGGFRPRSEGGHTPLPVAEIRLAPTVHRAGAGKCVLAPGRVRVSIQ